MPAPDEPAGPASVEAREPGFPYGVAPTGPVPALAPAVSLSAFAPGAVCGARLEAFVEDRGRRWFVTGLSAEAVLILTAAAGWGLAPRFGDPGARQLLVSAALSPAMGIRNVTSLRVNLAGVPTTLVTRPMTSFLGGSLIGQDRTGPSGTGPPPGCGGRGRSARCSRADWPGRCSYGPAGRWGLKTVRKRCKLAGAVVPPRLGAWTSRTTPGWRRGSRRATRSVWRRSTGAGGRWCTRSPGERSATSGRPRT
ncbi:DUF1275 family protein [Streptomyces sp. NPDC058401]|uniref:DUF1275 family protein n=1 Tax=Streptomyces sp. NPDC058401 TaxID=3346480 RepID=UPI003652876B